MPNYLPILLFLRDHAEAVKSNPNFSLAQAVRDSLSRFNGPNLPERWIEAQLKRGRCLVLLDGLDEIADMTIRKSVATWVELQMVAFGSSRFIISSRPFGYRSNPLSGVAVMEICSFSLEQIDRFVHNWYVANEIMSAQKDDPGVRMTATQGAGDLLRRIQNTPVLADLAVNPLLLTMIATVHRYKSRLPGRRVELYREICEVFLGQRQEAKGLILDLTPAQKQRVLQPLAYHMLVNERRELPLAEAAQVIAESLVRVSPQTASADFLKNIENTSGLLIERENGIYGFAHLTFQEYLAAVHIHEQGLEANLTQHVKDSWWHETIRLYSAQGDATSILRACISSGKPSISALSLAFDCLDEAREVQPSVRAQIEAILRKGVDVPVPEIRRIVSESLLTTRLRRMIRVSDNKYIDTTFITNAEYQLFLDEMRHRKSYFQPDHWVDYQYSAGSGRLPVAGVRASDVNAFCDWLTQRELSGWHYRPPFVEEDDVKGIIHDARIKSSANTGYWSVTDQIAKCVDSPAFAPIVVKELSGRRFSKDVSLAHDVLMNLDRLRLLASAIFDRKALSGYEPFVAEALDRSGGLCQALGQIPYSEVNRGYGRMRYELDLSNSFSGATAYNRISQLAKDLDLQMMQNLAWILEVDGERSDERHLLQGRNFELTETCNLTHVLDFDYCKHLAHEIEKKLQGLLLIETIATNKMLAKRIKESITSLQSVMQTADLQAIRFQVTSLIANIVALAHSGESPLSSLFDHADSIRDILSQSQHLSESIVRNIGVRESLSQAIAHSQELAVTAVLEGASRALVYEQIPETYSSRSDAHELWRWYRRIRMLAVVAESNSQVPAKPSPGKEVLPGRIFLDYYISLAILEERIQGNLSAFEGIWLIRERERKQKPVTYRALHD